MNRDLETYGPVIEDSIFRLSESCRENREGKVDKALKEIMTWRNNKNPKFD